MVSEEQLACLVANEPDMAYKRRVKLFLRWLTAEPGERVLDAACGRGFVLNFLRRVSDYRLVGQDLAGDYVRQAHAQLDARGVGLSNGDLCRLSFADRTFDKVILAEVLEHLDDDRAGLAEAVRVTRPGGLIVVSVPNARYPFWWDPINRTLETVFGTHVAKGPLAGIWALHVRLYTLEEIVALVEEAGLEIEETRLLVHYCFPFIHNLVYGLGKPLLESGALPAGVAGAASRYCVDGQPGSRLNPVNVGLRLFNWVDRLNDRLDGDRRDVSAMNICLKVRVPG
jgi:2-polyprenyl-6-hydroxyphenyl methylase/3-demethylubiquinone-9 3-methyltransferase